MMHFTTSVYHTCQAGRHMSRKHGKFDDGILYNVQCTDITASHRDEQWIC